MEPQQFARGSFSGPSDLALGHVPLQLASEGQRQNGVPNMTEAADQKARTSRAHDFQSFENRNSYPI
jgi:hypothetical protein